MPIIQGQTAMASDFSFLFGGSGSDGVLVQSSGNVNINLNGAQLFMKNYSSISITGTGSVTFINPHANGTTIILKCKGDCTLTSSISPMLDASKCGAIGASSVTTNYPTGATSGNAGTDGIGLYPAKTNKGNYQAGGALPSVPVYSAASLVTGLAAKYPWAFVGAGGASGNTDTHISGSPPDSAVSGKGGRGGGCLIIECNGAWNFTTANGISVAGESGGNATSTHQNGNACASGGGGGGGGGFFGGWYRSLTANSGTVNKSGGAGGYSAPDGNASFTNSAGGGGGSVVNAGGNGSSGNSNTTAQGGAGGDGYAVVEQNSAYA